VTYLILTLVLLWCGAFALNHLLLYVSVNRFVAMFVSMAVFGVGALAIHFQKISATLREINSFRL